jgi:hypothetical protein
MADAASHRGLSQLQYHPWDSGSCACFRPKGAAGGCTYLKVFLILTPLHQGIEAPRWVPGILSYPGCDGDATLNQDGLKTSDCDHSWQGM